MYSIIAILWAVLGFILLQCQAASAIEFRAINLTNPDGTDYSLQGLVAVEFVPDSDSLMLLVASYLGTIYLFRVDHVSPYRYVCRQVANVTVPNGRSVLDITSDPFTTNVFFIPTTIFGYTSLGLPQSEWDNGQIFVLKLSGGTSPDSMQILPIPLITGLPVANTTLGTGLYTVAVAADGALFISQGLHTNMGAPSPPDFQEDSYYSGAILRADIRNPDKTLKVDWDSDNIVQARPRNETKSGISLYATGFRTVFSPVISTRGDLFVNDGGGEANNGSKSISCDEAIPPEDEPDRQMKVREGHWYGSANRARGLDDPKYCVHLWGDEPNLTNILKTYPEFQPPLFTTKQAVADNVLGSGTFGFLQYLPNWFPYLRKKFIATEYDLTEPETGRPFPIMYALDIWRRRLFKLANAPGVSAAVDKYGSVFVGQLNVAKIAIAVPVVKNWMKRQPKVRNVWPTRGKPGSEIWILGSNMKEARIEIGDTRCVIVKRRKYFDLQLTSCIVPTMTSYSNIASDVRVGKLFLKEAFTVVSPDMSLELPE